MKLTAQEEYGLRCLLQIARAPGGFLTIREIAAREALTPAYVAKIMRSLRLAGLVTSARGKNGGYQLAGPPSEVSVGAVLRILGGGLFAADFCQRHAGESEACVHDARCSLRPMWLAIDAAIQQALARTHLTDLLRLDAPLSLTL